MVEMGLAGRCTTMRVLPLSLEEFFRLCAEAQPGGTASPGELSPRYREVGGLPGLFDTDRSPYLVQQMLRDIHSTIALRDIVNLAGAPLPAER